MKLGMVTYLMGKDMTIPELLKLCEEAGLQGLELRATHAHGVEIELTPGERAEVKKVFEDSPVELVGLGSAYEFHQEDPEEVKRHIEGSFAYAQLAADVGAPGIKVRPNRLLIDKGIPAEKTCEQIGNALRQVGTFAAGIGIEVRVEVHGRGTSDPRMMRQIMDHADHPNVYICWNSNSSDMDENQSIQWSFDLLKDKLALVHLHEIGIYNYPYQTLFDNLKAMNYRGFCLAEIQYNPEPVRFMQYFRTMFDLYTGLYKFPQA